MIPSVIGTKPAANMLSFTPSSAAVAPYPGVTGTGTSKARWRADG